MPVHPHNLFYVGIPFEIGVIGALGVFALCFYPIVLVLRHDSVSRFKARFAQLGLFDRLAFVLVFGIPFWLVAEFDVIRISATNQLFILVWTTVVLHLTVSPIPTRTLLSENGMSELNARVIVLQFDCIAK